MRSQATSLIDSGLIHSDRGSIHQEVIEILNIVVRDNRVSKYIKKRV